MSYPAKILLFGEHTVLRGGRGLAVPFPRRSLRWVMGPPDERLLDLARHLTQAIPATLLATAALRTALQQGARLQGDIPTGYGLGSSGAVCAAIWDRFATPTGRQLSHEALREQLATMERFFHGSSSGTDPLICFLNRPLTLGGGQPPTPVALPAQWGDRFFLVDTGIHREAARFIQTFTRRYDTEADFAARVAQEWTRPANRCIQALLAGDTAELMSAFVQLSTFQYENLPDFIPAYWQKHWQGPAHQLKLCGAGGGGMLLGVLTRPADRAVVEQQLGNVIWVTPPPG